MGRYAKCSQKERSGKTRRGGRSPNLLRLAGSKRVHLCKPPRATQMLWMRKNGTRSPALPSCREGLRLSHRTHPRLGPLSSIASDYKTNTLFSFEDLRTASTWESQRSATPIPRPITIQLIPYTTYILISWKVSSQQAGTSAPSYVASWRPRWAHSNHHRFPLSPKHRNQANTGQFTTSHIHTHPSPTQHPSTHTLTATASHAPGEPFPRWHSSSPDSPQAHKHWCMTWQKPTGPYRRTPING